MPRLHTCILLLLVACASMASALWCRKLPPPMEDFDVTKVLGRWYYTWTSLPIQLPCKTANITLKAGGDFDLVEKYITTFDKDPRDFTYEVTRTPESPTGFSARSPMGNGAMVPIDTDYQTYLVNWWCTLRKGYVDILSRERTVPKETVEKVLAKLDNLKVQRSGIHTVEQDNCPDFF